MSAEVTNARVALPVLGPDESIVVGSIVTFGIMAKRLCTGEVLAVSER